VFIHGHLAMFTNNFNVTALSSSVWLAYIKYTDVIGAAQLRGH